jgi:hypothetical protein
MNHWLLIASVLALSSAFGLFLHFTRGNLTKNNRNKVRIQQLMNYVATSNNPSGKRAAINQLRDSRKTCRR